MLVQLAAELERKNIFCICFCPVLLLKSRIQLSTVYTLLIFLPECWADDGQRRSTSARYRQLWANGQIALTFLQRLGRRWPDLLMLAGQQYNSLDCHPRLNEFFQPAQICDWLYNKGVVVMIQQSESISWDWMTSIQWSRLFGIIFVEFLSLWLLIVNLRFCTTDINVKSEINTEHCKVWIWYWSHVTLGPAITRR